MRRGKSIAARIMVRRFWRSDFLHHGAVVFLSGILFNACNYVFHMAMLRKLGVAQYGALYSLIAALLFLSVPMNVLTTIVVRYAAEFRVLMDGSHLRALSRWFFVRTAAIGALIVLIGCALSAPFAAYLRIEDRGSVMIMVVILGLSIVLPSVRGILQGVQDFRRLAVSTLIEGVLKAALGIAFVFMGWGVNGAMLGYALGVFVSLVYTSLVVRRHFAATMETFHLNTRRLWATSMGVTAAMAGLAGLGFLDMLLVKHYFSPQDSSLYSVVSLVGKVLLFVVGFVPTIVLPKVTARVSHGRSPVPVIAQAGGAIAAICGCGLLALFIAPTFVLRIMSGGGAYLSAAPLLFPYGCAMTLLGGVNAAVAYKMGLHRFDFVAPLFLVLTGEVLAIVFVHQTLSQVVWILVVGHALAMFATLHRVGESAHKRSSVIERVA